MRGRLINPFLAELARLSSGSTAADPDGTGALTSGYDSDFKEPVVLSDGEAVREEHTHDLVPCQVEVETFDMLRMVGSGDNPDTRIILVFHFADLERLGLVDPATGDALIRKGDRLVAIRKCSDSSLIQAVRTPPGLYVTEPRVRSFGLSGGERNLLVTTFKEREVGYE